MLPLPAIIGLALAVRAWADRAGEHIVPYLGTYYAKQVAVVEALPWWKLLLPLDALDGRCGTSPRLLAASRESLVESHIVHDFEPARVLDNLAGCYGTLIQGVYREVLPLLKGRRVID